MLKQLIAVALIALVSGCTPPKPDTEPKSFGPTSPALEKSSGAPEPESAPAPADEEAPGEADGLGESKEEARGRKDDVADKADHCDSAECDEWCKDAGDLLGKCAAAFAAGCSKKPQPAGVDCNWQAKPLKSVQQDNSEPSPTPERQSPKSKPVVEDKKVDLEPSID